MILSRLDELITLAAEMSDAEVLSFNLTSIDKTFEQIFLRLRPALKKKRMLCLQRQIH